MMNVIVFAALPVPSQCTSRYTLATSSSLALTGRESHQSPNIVPVHTRRIRFLGLTRVPFTLSHSVSVYARRIYWHPPSSMSLRDRGVQLGVLLRRGTLDHQRREGPNTHGHAAATALLNIRSGRRAQLVVAQVEFESKV